MPTVTVQKTVKVRQWTIAWVIFVISTYLISFGYLAYGFVQGLKGNKKYQYISNLVTHPSWKNFKIFIATLANNPITDILLLLFFVLIPIPSLPYYGYQRIELLLAKIGIYQLLIMSVLGSPNYDPIKTNENMSTYIVGWIIFFTVIVLFIYSFIYAKSPKCVKKFLLPF